MKSPMKRGHVRYLLKKQNGRCALTGEKLNPKDVSIDHVIPLKSIKDNKKKDYGKFWLVKMEVNRMKGSLDLDKFLNLIEKIYKNKSNIIRLKNDLSKMKLKEMDSASFEEYITKNYDKNGVIKK
jgi:hypothetical protein